MEEQKRSIDWATMLVPFAIVIALMAVFMIFPEDSKEREVLINRVKAGCAAQSRQIEFYSLAIWQQIEK